MKRRKHKANTNETADESDAILRQEQNRLKKLLQRPICTHIIVNESMECDAHALSTIQTLIDRRIKLLSEHEPRKLSFVVLSTSQLASTIRLIPTNGTDEPTVTVRPFPVTFTKDKHGSPLHMALVQQLQKLVNDQYTRKLNRNIHGIFIHWGGVTTGAPALLAMLQCFFLDDTPGISRLDLQGVVTILRPLRAFNMDDRLVALTDRFVLAVRPQVMVGARNDDGDHGKKNIVATNTNTDDNTNTDHNTDTTTATTATTAAAAPAVKRQPDKLADVTAAKDFLSLRNPRAEILQGELGMNNLLVLHPKATQEIDEIFAYSRVVVTQIFPRDDDMVKIQPLSKNNDETTSLTSGVFLILPNHKSVELHKFQYWVEQLLGNDVHGNVLRMKGLLAMQGSRSKYILQGVGKSFGIEESHETFWNQSRRCTLLLVGQDLNGSALQQQLMQCMADESCLERCYWWADAHCCVLVLLLVFMGLMAGMVFMSALDFGYLNLDDIVLPWRKYRGSTQGST